MNFKSSNKLSEYDKKLNSMILNNFINSRPINRLYLHDEKMDSMILNNFIATDENSFILTVFNEDLKTMLHLNIDKDEAKTIEFAANLLDDKWLDLGNITYKWHSGTDITAKKIFNIHYSQKAWIELKLNRTFV